MTKHFALATNSFYYEFVINSGAQTARVTKRAFRSASVNFYDQSTTMSIDKARSYYKQLQAATN